MIIRKAITDDLEIIQSFQKKLSEYESQFTDEFNSSWSSSSKGKKFFEKTIKGRNSFGLIAEEDNKLIGYLVVTIRKSALRRRNKLALLDFLFVDDKYRDKGIGTMLLQEATRILKERKIPRFQLYVLKANVDAIDFYKKNGFTEFISIFEKDL